MPKTAFGGICIDDQLLYAVEVWQSFISVWSNVMWDIL